MITAYGAASRGNEHYILTPTPTAAGHLVARTRDDVLEGVAAWPTNIYELRVDPRDVLEQGKHMLRVRAYEVVRAMPREQIFGPSAAKLDALFTDAGAFDWLRPSSEDRRPRAAVLVAEHYAALGHHGNIRAGGLRMLRDVDKVEPLITRPYAIVARAESAARTRALTAASRAVDRRLDLPMKAALARVVFGKVIPRAWRAAWEHVAGAHVECTAAVLRQDSGGVLLDDLGDKLLERTARALEVAMEPGLQELTALPGDAAADGVMESGRLPIHATVALAQAEGPAEWGAAKDDFDKIIAGLVERVWFYAWRFITHATHQIVRHAFHLASGLREPDPCAPWVAMFRLGLWPMVDDGVDVTVYNPPATGE